jgi:hypothetical protein
MTLEELLKEKLPRYTKEVAMDLCKNGDDRQAAIKTRVNVTMTLEAGWTVQDVIDSFLTWTQSPVVKYQNGSTGRPALRLGNVPASTFVVPKAGSRTVQPDQLEMLKADLRMAGKAKEKVIEVLEKYNVPEELIAMLDLASEPDTEPENEDEQDM